MREKEGLGITGAADQHILHEVAQGTTLWATVSRAISGPLTVWLQKPFGERLVLAA